MVNPKKSNEDYELNKKIVKCENSPLLLNLENSLKKKKFKRLTPFSFKKSLEMTFF